MHKTKTDDKNIELLKLVAQLRDHIDLYRIIGLNAGALRDSKIGGALPGYLQKSAQELLAMYICKIFESSPRNELNSIPEIIESCPLTRLSDKQKQEFSTFGKKYGNHSDTTEPRSYLMGTFGLFCGIHSESLARLKEFRDKIGAHSDSKANIQSLPSPAEFEILYSFANDFYELIRSSINNLPPVLRPHGVGDDFVRLLQFMGLHEAKFDFDEEK
jgi:AbiU2